MRSLSRWNEAIYLSVETKGAPPTPTCRHHQRPTHRPSLIQRLSNVNSGVAPEGRKVLNDPDPDESHVWRKTQTFIAAAAAISAWSKRRRTHARPEVSARFQNQSDHMITGNKATKRQTGPIAEGIIQSTGLKEELDDRNHKAKDPV